MPKIEQIQQILGVKVDNEGGTESKAALDTEVRKSLAVVAPPTVPVVSFAHIHPFVAIAREWMGRSETSRNRFDGDKKLWSDTNYPDGWEDRAPYCAAFQCYVVAEAVRRGAKVQARPTSPSVSAFRNWARSHGFIAAKPPPPRG